MRRAACLLLLVSLPGAAQILWREPRPLTDQDWICGPGGCDHAPVPPFRFVKEDLSGSTPKVTVRDGRNRSWSVKFGAEVIPEVFAPRFLMALGYFAEHTYFVASGRIEGIDGKLKRARRQIQENGAFVRARFEPRDDPDMEFLKGRVWAWDDTPYRGKPQLAGLKIVMMLLSNWDTKDARFGDDSNNAVFRMPLGEVFSTYDWGASLGRWGGVLRRDQSDCAGFALDSPHFVHRIAGGLEFGFKGKDTAAIKMGITVEDAQWLLPYLQRIRLEALQTGLRASGATPRQAACWAASIEQRIAELRRAAQ